jgi:hypothetical protein
MFKKHVSTQLSAYCHGELSGDESRRVAEHLLGCRRCRNEYEEIKFGVQLAKHLPLVSAPESLWSEIERELERAGMGESLSSAPRLPRSSAPWRYALAAGLILAVGIGVVWYYTTQSQAAWEVARLEGAPRVGSSQIGATGRLAVGEWLETDSASRAKITVGQIGEVEVEPNTRLQLVNTQMTDHRLSLARGTMHAKIWAPPRLFFVETPSAVAVDLGCAYTLEVDDAGRSFLHVTSGWVALQLQNRESMVPAGALCQTRPRIGPGTPFFEDATEKFQAALAKLDFENGGREALDAVLSESRVADTLTLWHLLYRVDEARRGQLYDRMAGLVPPPAGVTREGVLKLDETNLNQWREKLEPRWQREDLPVWRKAWREVWKHLR